MSNIQEKMGEIAVMFLSIRNLIKVYHWQTYTYSRHKASDKLVKSLSEKIDQFMEVLQGKRGVRLIIPDNNTFLAENQTDTSIVELLNMFKKYLSDKLPTYLYPEDTDLLNIRDEMLANINQTLYLFTFS